MIVGIKIIRKRYPQSQMVGTNLCIYFLLKGTYMYLFLK